MPDNPGPESDTATEQDDSSERRTVLRREPRSALAGSRPAALTPAGRAASSDVPTARPASPGPGVEQPRTGRCDRIDERHGAATDRTAPGPTRGA